MKVRNISKDDYEKLDEVIKDIKVINQNEVEEKISYMDD